MARPFSRPEIAPVPRNQTEGEELGGRKMVFPWSDGQFGILHLLYVGLVTAADLVFATEESGFAAQAETVFESREPQVCATTQLDRRAYSHSRLFDRISTGCGATSGNRCAPVSTTRFC